MKTSSFLMWFQELIRLTGRVGTETEMIEQAVGQLRRYQRGI